MCRDLAAALSAPSRIACIRRALPDDQLCETLQQVGALFTRALYPRLARETAHCRGAPWALPAGEGRVQVPPDACACVAPQVKGVGRWTVEMLMMFSLGRTNCLPVADLGVRKVGS